MKIVLLNLFRRKLIHFSQATQQLELSTLRYGRGVNIHATSHRVILVTMALINHSKMCILHDFLSEFVAVVTMCVVFLSDFIILYCVCGPVDGVAAR